MKQTTLRNVVSKVHLPEDTKRRIKNACYLAQMENEKHPLPHSRSFIGLRITAIVCCLLALSASVYAAAELSQLYVKKDGNNVTIVASSELSSRTEESAPLRAWNAADGEISVQLICGYMPQDMTENKTAQGKWNGSDNTRSITFSGFDLRRGDLNTVIKNINDTKFFAVGENDAYILHDASEIALYDKLLFVHFEKEQLVVRARVGCGITEEEILSIAAGMRIEETQDPSLALPISNELPSQNHDEQPPFSVEITEPDIQRSTLFSVGEEAHYDGLFGICRDMTITSFEVFDSIPDIDSSGFTSFGLEKLSDFTDDNGNFIPYNRTDIDLENGVFGETVEMTKRFVLISVSLSGHESDADARSFLQTFHLSSCSSETDTIISQQWTKSYVIDRTPGKSAGTSEPIYRFHAGNGQYLIGYLIDTEFCEDELLCYSSYAEIGYLLR